MSSAIFNITRSGQRLCQCRKHIRLQSPLCSRNIIACTLYQGLPPSSALSSHLQRQQVPRGKPQNRQSADPRSLGWEFARLPRQSRHDPNAGAQRICRSASHQKTKSKPWGCRALANAKLEGQKKTGCYRSFLVNWRPADRTGCPSLCSSQAIAYINEGIRNTNPFKRISTGM